MHIEESSKLVSYLLPHYVQSEKQHLQQENSLLSQQKVVLPRPTTVIDTDDYLEGARDQILFLFISFDLTLSFLSINGSCTSWNCFHSCCTFFTYVLLTFQLVVLETQPKSLLATFPALYKCAEISALASFPGSF